MALGAERSRRGGFRRHLDAHFAGVVLASLVLSSCGAGSDGAQPGSTVPATTAARAASTVPTTTADPQAEVVARYQAYWEARFAANQAPPDPDDPALAEYATGQQLEQVRAETRDNLEKGLALRQSEDPAGSGTVKVVSLAADEATLQECVVDDDVVYRYATGEIVDDAVATYNVEGTMLRVGGSWKLASARQLQRWEGVAGCALSGEF